MARATWQGHLTIGQLGVPIRLYSAARTSRPQFVLLHKTDDSPVERVLCCAQEHRNISADDVVRAVPYGDKYITLTPRELERTTGGPAKEVRVMQFTASETIPPLYYERSYYIVAGKGGERAYALIREVFAEGHHAAVVRYLLHNREHIGLVAVWGDMLLLHQLRFAADTVPRSSIKTPPLPKPTPAEIKAFSSVIKRFTSPVYIEDYRNEHDERVHELIERKAKGLTPRRRERIAPRATPEAKLMDALQNLLHTANRHTLPERTGDDAGHAGQA